MIKNASSEHEAKAIKNFIELCIEIVDNINENDFNKGKKNKINY